MVITSQSNDLIKKIKMLMEKARARRKEQLFVVEGIKMVEEIPSGRLQEIVVSESFHNNNPSKFSDAIIISDKLFKDITDTVTPQGVLAIVKMNDYAVEDLFGNNSGCVIILDHLQDPGNMGTIIRTAEAAGVAGIIMTKDSVDFYNPKVVRSTMGAIFRVPIIVVDDLLSAIAALKSDGFNCIAAHLDGEIVSEINWPAQTAFMIGNESKGLSDEVANKADRLVKIPMEGKVESLNAAVAAAILMYSYKLQ